MTPSDHHAVQALRQPMITCSPVAASGRPMMTSRPIASPPRLVSHIDVRDDARALLEAHYEQSGLELNAARLRMARIPDGAC